MKLGLELAGVEIVDPTLAVDRIGRLPNAPLAMPKQRLEVRTRGWAARVMRALARLRPASGAARRGGR